MDKLANARTVEEIRLTEAREKGIPWRKWGPYLSERQWGTVREDYSDDGNAWGYFSHDQARSRIYRWGEDGLAGLSDDKQRLCFALGLWNGKDPIIKERLFGLTNSEGNHGEDVKEYYYYLDSTPTHSYMKYLYKYPQRAYPYSELINSNRKRTRNDPEYELIDTGIFSDNRYFDVFVEFSKNSPDDILIKLSVYNRGPDPAALHVLPTLWFRNTWGVSADDAKPNLKLVPSADKHGAIAAWHAELGEMYLYHEGQARLLFTENETNNARVFGIANSNPYVKDAFDQYLVHGKLESVNPAQKGTKAAVHYSIDVEAGHMKVLRLRLTNTAPGQLPDPFGEYDRNIDIRRRECDLFYSSITPAKVGPDAAQVMRQALAGMLWSKQYYSFDVHEWLKERNVNPLSIQKHYSRNQDWFHMINDQVISMPDKWEYPWYAAWDLAFHTVALSTVDLDFAKDQLNLVLRGTYMHPNGQVPAYEWNFSDVNPPVHAWATIFLFRTEQAFHGTADLDFLKRMYDKLLLNFTWWVNRKDRFGKNVFEGGFLGLDNIGVFDRSSPLPTGGHLEQADGTAWMSLFSQNMLELSIELASHDDSYNDLAVKFAEHFLWIASAINRVGTEGMWDDSDGFYYDVLRLPDGSAKRLKVRSMVGLLPLCATTIFDKEQRERVPDVTATLHARIQRTPELLAFIHPTGPGHLGAMDRGIFSLVNPERLRRILTRMLDENEFLSPYGIRSLSKYHLDNPYVFNVEGHEYRVAYLPAESDSGMFGGNSNWRGPVWMPVNVIIIRALLSYYLYYGDKFKIECPTGSGRVMNLFEIAEEISNRLTRIFTRNENGLRPVFGGAETFQRDPHWRNNLLFYEYFHGDNGAGLGASHQTGWTGVVAKLIQLFGHLDSQKFLQGGKSAVFNNRGASR